jgi:hypothetical protein
MREHWEAEGRKKGAAVLLNVVAVGITAVLSGCGSPAAGGHILAGKVVPTAPGPAPAASTVPTEAPAAESLALRITDSLDALAAQTPKPDAGELRAAFVSAGAEAGAVEVSIDTTPTGLEVDAMTGAVSVGASCVFGHIRDGAVTVTQLPVLATGLCFVGDQR